MSKSNGGRFTYIPAISWLVTRARAEKVRKLRVVARGRHGTVARVSWRDWGRGLDRTWDANPGNPLVGLALCEAAAPYFDEEHDKAPWA